ncbi:MAG: serine/threonine protein kinase [Acidobacteria bacterium]|jgi:tetratricopeptide (TPR) repeat protein|nr:serine/threonine protein kinase [Acidobacteriota bacterium]
MLTPDRERTALQLFADVFELDHEARLDWLVEACGGDPELLGRVIELMEADSEVTSLAGEIEGPPLELPPDEIGVYKLDALIGAGGMGSVYRAHRADGLFDQTVAIKFMRARQGAFDLGPLIDAERRALARMDHESIARILDGGVTGGGLSYLVMEYVAGEPLDDDCEARALSVEARVALVRQVAGALAHAHQSRIVHCDVKPSNILVTPGGRAKLIDFGIARLQEVVAADVIDGVTRAYASPERNRKQPATLADDVYSLAVTLYQLLAGRLPWPDPGRADLDAPAEPLVIQGAARNPEDLAAILATALSLDPAKRYRSIEAFDADLARWQGLQAVSAVPRTFAYLAKRFSQRRPVVLASIAGGVGATFAALGIITHLYLAAEESRRNADQRFTELRTLAGFMIFDLNSQLEQVPGSTPARLAMSEKAQVYLDTLGASAGDNAALQAEAATGLVRLAEVQGVPSRPNLGLGEQAAANLERAIASLDTLLAQAPEDAGLRLSRGRALYFQAVLKGAMGQDTAAQLELARKAEPDVLAALAAPGETPVGQINSLLLGVRLTVADAIQTQGDLEGALAIREAEEARIRSLDEDGRAGMDFDYEAGRIAALLGDSNYYLGRITDSQAAYARSAEFFSAGLKAAPLNRRLLTGLHYAHYSLSSTRADLGDLQGGLREAEESLTVARRLLDWDPTDRLAQRLLDISEGQIALMLKSNGRPEEALAIVERQLEGYRAFAAAHPEDGDAYRRVAVPMRGRAEMMFDARGKAAGCKAAAEAQAAWDAVEAKWGLSDFDRHNDLDQIAEMRRIMACR